MKDDHHLILHLILYLIYREKTVYIKTHKTAMNRAVDYTGWRSKLPAWKGVRNWAGMCYSIQQQAYVFIKEIFSQSLQPVCLSTFFMSYTPRKQLTELALSPDGNQQQSSRIIVRQTDNINLPNSKNTGLKISKSTCMMGGRKISKTENKVTVANCDVENLDHQN